MDSPVPKVIYALDNLCFLEVNRAAVEFYGYSRDEFLQMKATDIQLSENVPQFLKQHQPSKDFAPHVTETRHRCKDGSVSDVSVTRRQINFDDRSAVLAVVQDISERNAATQALERERSFLGQVMAHVTNAIYALDIEGRFTLLNSAAAEITGYSVEELLGKPFSLLFAPATFPQVMVQFQRVAVAGEIVLNYEVELVRKDGAHRVVNLYGSPLYDDGRIVSVVGMAEDVTERKKALRELERNNVILSTQQETSLDAILLVDENATILSFNRRFVELLRVPEELVHARIDGPVLQWAVAQVEDPEAFVARIRYLYEHKNEKSREEIRMKDGRIIDRFSAPVISSDGEYYGRIWYFRDITERKRAEETLRASEERFRATFEEAAVGMGITDLQERLLRVNKRLCDMLGYTREEMLQKTVQDITYPEDTGKSLAVHIRQIAGDAPASPIEKRYVRKDGNIIWAELSGSLVRDAAGQPAYYIGVIEDISARKRQETLLAGEKRVLEMLALGAPLDEVLEAMAKLYEQQYGQRKQVAILLQNDSGHLGIGCAPSLPESFKRRCDAAATNSLNALAAQYRDSAVRMSDIANDPSFASVRDAIMPLGFKSCWSRPVLSGANELLGIFIVYNTDSSEPTMLDRELLERACQLVGIAIEKFRDQETLASMAYYDVLTGLPNRVLLQDRLRQAMIEAERHERLVALMFMDLDRFKNINDTLGHEMGDLLLKKVAKRLQECVRPGDTVARPGGDEFILVLAGVAHVDDVSRVAQKVVDAFALPFEIGGREQFVTCSIGVTLYPFDDRDIETLYRNADVAMYHAKEEGRNNFQFYSAEMNAQSYQRLTLENSLRHGLEREEFRLYYQPQVDLADGRIIGAEALIRWQHPELGLVSPADFIPLAEETGLIVPIGEWALRQACTQARAWQAAGLEPVRVAVNLSARQFRQQNLIDIIGTTLQQTGLAPEWLEVELTESLVMHDVNRTIEVLRGLEQRGVSVAVDDFGTGYSSLSYLRRLPIDVIKIDRSFIEHISDNADDAAIAVAIIALANSLQLKVVAEGVETRSQLNFLRHYDCDAVQGFYYSRPLPADDFTDLLRNGLRAPG